LLDSERLGHAASMAAPLIQNTLALHWSGVANPRHSPVTMRSVNPEQPAVPPQGSGSATRDEGRRTLRPDGGVIGAMLPRPRVLFVWERERGAVDAPRAPTATRACSVPGDAHD